MLSSGKDRPRRRAAFLAVAVDLSLLLAVFLTFFWPFVFGGAVFSCLGETRDEFFPLTHYTGSMLCKGILPLWDPYSFCGFPHVSLGYTSAFYPTAFIYGLEPYSVWSKAALLPHAFLGVAFAYLLGRSLFRRRTTAVALGILYLGCAPMMLSFATNNPCFVQYMAWIPLALLCLLRLLDTGRWPWALGFALALLLQILGSAPHGLLYELTAFGVLCGLDLVRRVFISRESARAVTAKGAMALGAVFLAVLAGAVQVAPSMELVSGHSIRSLPDPGGYYFNATISWAQAASRLGWTDAHPLNYRVYWFTPAGLVFCVFVLLGRGKSKSWLVFLTLAACSVFVIGGETIVDSIIDRLMELARCRGMSRIVYVLTAMLSVLAACGVEWMLSLAHDRRFSGVRFAVLAAAGAVFVALPVMRYSPGAWVSAAAYALLAAGALLGFLLPQRTLAVKLLILASLTADLWGAPVHNLATGSPADYELGEAREAVFAACDSLDRKYVLGESDQITHPPQTLCPGLMARARGVSGYNALNAARFAEFLYAASGNPEPLNTMSARNLCRFYMHHPGWLSEQKMPALDLFNVRYLAVDNSTVPWIDEHIEHGGKRFTRREIGRFTVYDNHHALPVAFTMHDARVLEDKERLLETLFEKGFDYRSVALLEAPFDTARLAPATRDEPVEVVEYAANEVELSVDMSAPGLVVLTDMYYPGWRASVDGGPSEPVLAVDHVLRGVFVPEGVHRVRLAFRPKSVQRGLWVSNSVLAALAAAMLLALLRGRAKNRKGKVDE